MLLEIIEHGGRNRRNWSAKKSNHRLKRRPTQQVGKLNEQGGALLVRQVCYVNGFPCSSVEETPDAFRVGRVWLVKPASGDVVGGVAT